MNYDYLIGNIMMEQYVWILLQYYRHGVRAILFWFGSIKKYGSRYAFDVD